MREKLNQQNLLWIFLPPMVILLNTLVEYSRAKRKEEAKSDLNKYTKKLSEQLAFLKKMSLNITKENLQVGQ